MKPVRLQLSRQKGFRLHSPNGLPIVRVDRVSMWGNPFVAEDNHTAQVVALFREDLEKEIEELRQGKDTQSPTMRIIALNLGKLRGKNLACWCPLDAPCHADVLLDLANKGK